MNKEEQKEEIINHLVKNCGYSEYVANVCYKDMADYDDILNEYYVCTQNNDEIPEGDGVVVAEGYTARDIKELNPSFKLTGVYTFLGWLRKDPEAAKAEIKRGFIVK